MKFSSRLRSLGFLVCLSLSSSAVVAEEVKVLAEVAKLVALDGREFDNFGSSVSLDGNRLAVGAFGVEYIGSYVGAAYVFERDADGNWLQVIKLLALDGDPFDSFGNSISLDGDRLVVAAHSDSDNGPDSGSAYVFERDLDGSWIQVIKLLALDGQEEDSFGFSVSLAGDRLAVGAYRDDDNGSGSGSAYLFERGADGSWLEATKLLASDGQADDAFGISVSLAGDRLAVGAQRDDDNGLNSGSAYLFERNADGSWSQVSKLVATDGEAFDAFGDSVSLAGDRLAVGASLDDDNGNGAGSTYLFERNADGAWIQTSKLLATDGQELAGFGNSVSLAGDRLAVGADGDGDNGHGAGSTYVFERDVDGNWAQVAKLLALDGNVNAFLGRSVSLDGDRLAAGAYRDDDNGRGSGSVYFFEPVIVSPELTISGSCPGEVRITSTGTTPRSRFGTYGSSNQGLSEVEVGRCVGTPLDLDTPRLLLLTASDFDAEGTLVRTLAEPWCGSYLQVLDERTCLTSEAVLIP